MKVENVEHEGFRPVVIQLQLDTPAECAALLATLDNPAMVSFLSEAGILCGPIERAIREGLTEDIGAAVAAGADKLRTYLATDMARRKAIMLYASDAMQFIAQGNATAANVKLGLIKTACAE
jgi:hypothetical protein